MQSPPEKGKIFIYHIWRQNWKRLKWIEWKTMGSKTMGRLLCLPFYLQERKWWYAIACHYTIFHIKLMAINTLENINWLPASKKTWACSLTVQSRKCLLPYSTDFFMQFLLLFWKGQVHKKESKLEIISNKGKSHIFKHSQKE